MSSCSGTKKQFCFLTEGPLISVVVPVYNVEKYLKRCMDSILEQTYQNLEIILVDDGSTDTSLRIMEEYVQQDDRVRLVKHEKNRGLFQARISGSEAATGRYIAFIDSDDYISIDWFRTLVKTAESSDADIVVGEWCFDYDGTRKNYPNLDPFRINDYCLEGADILQAFVEQEFTCFSWTVVWNKLYRKELWDSCLPTFQEFSNEHGHMLMWEDIAFSCVLWSHAHKVVNAHQILYYYLKHSQAATSHNRNKRRNLKYIADASAAIRLFDEVLSQAHANKETGVHIDRWRVTAASIVYHDLVVNNCDRHSVRMYERRIREAFEYYGDFTEPPKFFYSLTTDLHPAFEWQEDIKKGILSPRTKYVSFDVFDTLVQRPFVEPTDLFSILSDAFNQDTSSYVDFAELRIAAERSCREKNSLRNPSAEDITLAEIYFELAETTVITQEKLSRMKALEQEMEIRFCRARKAGKCLFDLAIDAGKNVIICSDMYLPKDTIEQILSKAGYRGYQKFYLSSELLLTKASGSLFRYVQKDLGCKDASEIVHIGDNWASDIECAQKHKWKAYHLPKAMDMLRNYNPGVYSGEAYHRIWGRNGQRADYWESMNAFPGLRNVVALSANRIFDNPFVSFNPQSDFNADPNYVGYMGLGMHLLAVCKWVLKIAEERKIPTIHFVARDGYMVKKAFDLLNNSETSSNYIRVSRKSLILADVNGVEDLYSLHRKINVPSTSPKKLVGYLKPIIPCEDAAVRELLQREHFFYDRNFRAFSEYERCIKVLVEKAIDFSLLPVYRAELQEYFSKIVKPGDVIFDVGYSGRPETALSSILGFSVGSLYIHVNSDMAVKRQRHYRCPSECFYGNKPCITGVMREHLMMELGPSTIGYEKVDGKLIPKLESYEGDYASELITQIVQKAAISFVRDYRDTFGAFGDSVVLPLEALSAPFEYYLHGSKPFDRQIFATLPFEDSLGTGRSIDALDFWNQEIGNHGLAMSNAAVIALPPELSDIYMDGLFVKFYRLMNKWFPRGGTTRAAIKRIAGIFVR